LGSCIVRPSTGAAGDVAQPGHHVALARHGHDGPGTTLADDAARKLAARPTKTGTS